MLLSQFTPAWKDLSPASQRAATAIAGWQLRVAQRLAQREPTATRRGASRRMCGEAKPREGGG